MGYLIIFFCLMLQISSLRFLRLMGLIQVFPPFRRMLAVGFPYIAVTVLRYVFFYTCIFFYHEYLLDFIKYFFCICWDDQLFFVLWDVYLVYYILHLMNHPWISGIKPTCSWWRILSRISVICLQAWCWAFLNISL